MDEILFADDVDCLEIKEPFKMEIAVSTEALESYGIMFQKLKEIAEQWKKLLQPDDVEKEKIKVLERRKKHCKNYLELKQIDRELNMLKYGRRKGVQDVKSMSMR